MSNKRVLLLPFFIALIIILVQFIYITSISTIKDYISTPIIEDDRGAYLTEGDGSLRDYGYWILEDTKNLRVKDSIIAIEDKRFFNHFGLDFRAIFRAIKENVVNKNPQGASTLAMQVVRIQEQNSRTLITKIYETSAAFFMTIRYGREAVLKQYMTIVPLGKRIHGFSYGARRYFQKPIEDLSWAESAILASLPKAPSRMNLTTYRGMALAKDRGEIVLKRLFDQGFLDEDVYTRELENLKDYRALGLEKRPTNSYHYLIRLSQELKNRELQAYTGTIKTHFNTKLQQYLRDHVSTIYEDLLNRDANNVAIIVTSSKGEVLGYIGSENYYNENADGSINYANRRRSSGSTLKPFLYLKGLDDKKFFPSSIVDDLPIHIVDKEGSYIAANYDEDFLGPMLYRNTLANSRNIPSVRILEQIGLSTTYNYFNNLNFVHRERSPIYYGYGIILGGLYVTLEDLVTGYGSILNDGKKFNLKWFNNDDDSNGVSVGSEYNSRLITNFLSDPIARLPSFKRLGSLEYNYPVAIKTGTSQGYRDAWTIAYSKDYITAIWIGRNDNGKMNHLSGSIAAKYLKPVMNYLHPDQVQGYNQKPFLKPEYSIQVDICPLSGQIKGPNCPNSTTELFRESEAPIDICPVHISLAIDIRTGTLANHRTPIDKIQSRPFTKLPSRYAVWSSKNNLKLPVIESSEIFSESTIKITEPKNGARYIFDYETPARFQTIPIVADVKPNVPEIEWYINDKLYKSETYPYKIRFPLSPGEYKIEAVADTVKSNIVTIYVE
ncbi:MAG: transglycosylase domain-containing protein [Spirochaetaceae bacterium]